MKRFFEVVCNAINGCIGFLLNPNLWEIIAGVSFCILLPIGVVRTYASSHDYAKEEIEVPAIVVEMQHETSDTTTEQYSVTVTYEDISETFDNRTLYDSVKKGDTIQVVFCKEYDKKGNLISETLQIPD